MWDHNSPVHETECVDLDEAGTVDEHLGSHVTQSNQLGPVLQTNVVLFEDFQQMGSLSGPQATHELYQGGGVGMGKSSVNVHSHLIDTVHKLQG